MLIGLDAATILQPYATDIATAGFQFVCRYLKSLHAPEVAAFRLANVKIAAIWETTAGRSLGGKVMGAADGSIARSQLQLLGAPGGSAIYATVDLDVVTDANKDAVVEYMQAFKRSLLGDYRIGVYAEGSLLELCKPFVDFLWLPQACGWDGSRGDSDYHIHQGPTIATDMDMFTWADNDWPGMDFDYDPDIAVIDYFGQF